MLSGESARPIPGRPIHSSRVAIKPAVVVTTYALRVAGTDPRPNGCRRRLKTGHSDGRKENTQTDWRVITLEDWALIRRLAAEGVPKPQIAERLGISRTTVAKAVASDGRRSTSGRRCRRRSRRSRPRVRALLGRDPGHAGDGARRAGRLDGFDHVVPRQRAAAAAGASPAGSGGSAGVGGRVTRRSATCGSRRSGSRSRTASTALLPVLVITAAHSRFMHRADDADASDRGPAAGVVGADRAARAGPAPVDLGQRARHRPRQPAR